MMHHDHVFKLGIFEAQSSMHSCLVKLAVYSVIVKVSLHTRDRHPHDLLNSIHICRLHLEVKVRTSTIMRTLLQSHVHKVNLEYNPDNLPCQCKLYIMSFDDHLVLKGQTNTSELQTQTDPHGDPRLSSPNIRHIINRTRNHDLKHIAALDNYWSPPTTTPEMTFLTYDKAKDIGEQWRQWGTYWY